MSQLSLSIRRRLGVVIGLLLGLLAIVSMVAFHRFDTLSTAANALVDREARLAILATRANQHSQAAALHLLRLLLTPDREQRVALYAAMDEELRIADQALKQLENDNSYGLAAEVKEVRLLRDRYGDAFQATVEQIELDGPMSAKAHFETVTEPALKALLAATDMLAVHLQDNMQAQVQVLTAQATTAQQGILIGGLLALLAGIGLAVWASRSIIRPVNAAAAFADRIAAGDYGSPPPPAASDEVGSMLKAMVIMRDRVAEREARVRRIAYVDELTGLANRAKFFQGFADAPPVQGALLLVDIDRFSSINKVLGHAVGDALLKGVADRLAGVAGPGDSLARLWGDEFALMVRQSDPVQAVATAHRVREALRKPITIDGERLDLEASIGVALFPQDGADLSTLLKCADRALRRAKQRHQGVVLSADVPRQPEPVHLSLLGDLRTALEQSQFQVHYQPKMDLASRRIVGAEALIRWHHPTRGRVPPAEFIPFAEQTGFIREITPWVIASVIRQIAEWRRQGGSLVVSANLSAHDLLDGEVLIRTVTDAISREEVPPECLCLEITESALMQEPEVAQRYLERLARLGVKLAIDDYGSGHASLAYVKDLPVHELKIDRAFVAQVHRLPKSAAIVKSTVLLCQELGLSVVAEGAETPDEIVWLAHAGCHQVQGYGVAKPMPPDQLAGLMSPNVS